MTCFTLHAGVWHLQELPRLLMQTLTEYQVEAAAPSDHASFGLPKADERDLYNILLSLTVHSFSEDRPEDLQWCGKHCYAQCIRHFLGPTSSSQQDMGVQQAPLICHMLGQLSQIFQYLSNPCYSCVIKTRGCLLECLYVCVSVCCRGSNTSELRQGHALLLKTILRVSCLSRLCESGMPSAR